MNEIPENALNTALPPARPMEALSGSQGGLHTDRQADGVPGSAGARQGASAAAPHAGAGGRTRPIPPRNTRRQIEMSQRREEAVVRQQECPAPQVPCRQWMTSDELAVFLGVAEKTVRNMARRGDIPGHKLPPNSRKGQWRFDLDEVDRSIRTQKPEPKRKGLTVW